jgi:Domain of unknown function (DUF3850)
MKHKLKIWPEDYLKITNGERTFYVRKNDNLFQIDDILLLQEYIPDEDQYTGRFVAARITDILTDSESEYTILCINLLKEMVSL